MIVFALGFLLLLWMLWTFAKVLRQPAAALSGPADRRLDENKTAYFDRERELTEQRQALERSKDVLELHVQARTAQLDKLQRQYEGILNSAGEGICGLDLSGRVIFANPAAARITGWKVEELVGLSAREVFCGKPGEVEVTDGNDDARKPLEANDDADTVFYRKDGSVYPVEHLRSPVHEKNQLVGEVIVFKDITERKHAEAKLAQKAAELARSNDELEQFAFVASHDLQEPLRKIQAFGDRLKLRTEKLDLGDARDYLDRMQSAAARMQRLISDLLTFSRAIRSSQPFVPVDLGVTTREVLNDLEVRIEQSKARVEVGPLPTIEADPTQMRQLLQNLIGNALKFQRPGNPGVVRIRALTNGEARPSRFNGDEDDACELVVEDNGIGFDPKYSEKIFAVFQRLHGRTEYEGTGIGLAVCRRIVDRHRGEIIAQGRPGEGAAFTIQLPLRQAPETATHEHTEQTPDHTHGG